jgi:zinc transporter ZupT
MNDIIIAMAIMLTTFIGGIILWIIVSGPQLSDTMNAIGVILISFLSGLLVWAIIRGLITRSGEVAEAGRRHALAEKLAEQETRKLREKFHPKNFEKELYDDE